MGRGIPAPGEGDAPRGRGGGAGEPNMPFGDGDRVRKVEEVLYILWARNA